MKLQVTQENLARALNSVSRVASSRGTLPILSNVLVKTVGNRLSIAATNLDIAITHFIGSKVSQEGAITVPARLMQDFVSSLPGGVIELKLDDYKLHISTDQYQSVINGVSAEDYPVMPAITEGKSWKIAAKTLKPGCNRLWWRHRPTKPGRF
jgi:DNA polymerase III subunit beta